MSPVLLSPTSTYLPHDLGSGSAQPTARGELPPVSTKPSAVTPNSKASPDQQRLQKVAQEFEAVFLRQMLSSLERTTKISSGGQGNAAQSTYGSMVVNSVAEAVAKAGGLGLAQMLTANISSQYSGNVAKVQGMDPSAMPQKDVLPIRQSKQVTPASPEIATILPQGLSPVAVPTTEIRTSNVPDTGQLADRRIR